MRSLSPIPRCTCSSSSASVSLLLIGATRAARRDPGPHAVDRGMSYEFVANTVRSSAGTEGMKFFPFVFTLFMFVCSRT